METFILYGTAYTYEKPVLPDEFHREVLGSWAYGEYPQVHARIQLADGNTVGVYGHAHAWTGRLIGVRWVDDSLNHFNAWLLKADVRPATESEWDIYEYNNCMEELRDGRWAARLPGFIPADWDQWQQMARRVRGTD